MTLAHVDEDELVLKAVFDVEVGVKESLVAVALWQLTAWTQVQVLNIIHLFNTMKFAFAFANKMHYVDMAQKHINRFFCKLKNFQAKNSCWSERGQLPILRVIWDLSNCRQTCEPPNYWSASTILIAEMRIGTTLVFALASGFYIGLSSLHWQVVASRGQHGGVKKWPSWWRH